VGPGGVVSGSRGMCNGAVVASLGKVQRGRGRDERRAHRQVDEGRAPGTWGMVRKPKHVCTRILLRLSVC
jgi:hypothetical protein